jgi:hypothetical protein
MGPVLGGASVGAGAEYARLEPDTRRLEQIAEATGGRVLSWADAPTARLFDRSSVAPRRALSALWPALLWWTLLVFLMDVGTRRIAWDRLVSKRFGADWRAAAAEAVRDRSREAAATVGGLTARRGQRPAGPSVTLDAAEETRRQRAARQETERVRLQSIRDQMNEPRPGPTRPAEPRDAGPRPTEPRPADTLPDAPTDAGEGLLAAKRRARERYGEGGET